MRKKGPLSTGVERGQSDYQGIWLWSGTTHELRRVCDAQTHMLVVSETSCYSYTHRAGL